MMRRSMAMLALSGAAVVACDFPTEPPMWEQTWVVPGETVELSVTELLPAGISLTEDTSAFVAEAPGASVVLSLDAMCGTDCDPLFGSSIAVPKPAFGDTITTTTTLPADLVSATLAGGSVDVSLGHNFNFDPLRPSSNTTDERGYIRIRVLSAGNTVADTTIDGETQAFPGGTTISRTLAIQPVEVTNDLLLEVQIFSPEGDDTTLEASDTLGVALAPADVEIAEATVVPGTITVDPTSTTMDFAGIESDGPMLDRIQSGALRFRVQNPFTVAGTLDVAFQLPTGTIQRSLTIDEGSYTARIDFTGDELREILSAGAVDLLTSGTVAATGAGGTLTVTPRQELILENDFELVLLVGGSDEEEEN